MSVIKAITKSFLEKERKNFDTLYYLFDIHGTILKPNYEVNNIPTEFYPNAKETLQLLSKIPDICLILYTCSHPNEIEQYLQFFKNNDIEFKYVNENPEVQTQLNGYGCYDKKPYMNVLFEDKSGFDPETDWELVLEIFKNKI